MTPDFISRMFGSVIFALLGARFGAEATPTIGLPPEVNSVIFGLVGVLVGLILTPWLTVRPLRAVRNAIMEMPVDSLLTSLTGLVGGLLIALMLAYPLSQLEPPFGNLLPSVVSVVFGWLGLTIFRIRAREILSILPALGGKRGRGFFSGTERSILLDTSVLIDGRIVGIARTGFLGGTLAVPRFVINELHQVADSADVLRRARGRHGLEKLKELQREAIMPFKIIEDDIAELNEVDDKLVALALRMNAPIVTNDYPLNRIAEAQGVLVLNVNSLANEVRSLYLPGETISIRIIQEGREPNQGVGYLEDGTMVVVESGRAFMDRTINVEITKFINKETGRMYFAVPERK